MYNNFTSQVNCVKPIFTNFKKNINVNFNLCDNEQILSWGYHAENKVENKYGLYYYILDDNKQLLGIENLQGQILCELGGTILPYYRNPNDCNSCSCHSILNLPKLYLDSKITLVLITQKYVPFQNPYNDAWFYPGYQIGPTYASKIPDINNCKNELSERSVYNIWKTVICPPVKCIENVDFCKVGEIESYDLFYVEDTYLWSNDSVLTDMARVERILLKYLD